MSRKRRIVGVDLIKVLACFSVIMLHVSMPFFYSDGAFKVGNTIVLSKTVYYLGTSAVPLFFMANGFFLVNRAKMSINYVLNKIGLIMIPILGWNLIVFIPKIILKKNENGYFETVLGSLIQKGFFFQFWFLGALIIMLFLVPILNKIMKSSIKLYVIVLIIFLIISWLIDLYNHFSGAIPLQKNVIQTFRVWTWISYYMSGGLIGNLIKKINFIDFKKQLNYFSVVLTVLTIIYSIYNAAWISNPFAEYNYDNILIFIWIVTIFLTCISTTKFSKHSTKIIESISKYSFGIYIVHVIALKIFEKVFVFDGIFINLITIIGVFLISWLITFVISKTPYVNKLVVF
ncbi:acyltransferase [Pediococcus pentosaceus]|uniref:acyltransferase n=2 Tax=Pediococcus pentosaceus TaxID=1255 RepID=UPI00259B24FA|nr:acyltransferase family protein [uncultured Pediococcus sp.]